VFHNIYLNRHMFLICQYYQRNIYKSNMVCLKKRKEKYNSRWSHLYIKKMEKVKSWKCSRILCNRVSALRKLSSILAHNPRYIYVQIANSVLGIPGEKKVINDSQRVNYACHSSWLPNVRSDWPSSECSSGECYSVFPLRSVDKNELS